MEEALKVAENKAVFPTVRVPEVEILLPMVVLAPEAE